MVNLSASPAVTIKSPVIGFAEVFYIVAACCCCEWIKPLGMLYTVVSPVCGETVLLAASASSSLLVIQCDRLKEGIFVFLVLLHGFVYISLTTGK